jgi:lysophospholipase L1-like esterase
VKVRKSAGRAWISAGVILAGAGIIWSSRAKRPRIQAGTRLLVVGDSMAEALGPYFKAFGRDDNIAVDVLFKRGARIDYWREQPALAAALQTPALVLFVLGTNDQVGAHTSSAQAAAELAAAAEARGSQVAWVGPPTLTQGNDLGDALARVFGREYYDSRTLEIPRGPDGLHPSVSGAGGWAANVWEWLH